MTTPTKTFFDALWPEIPEGTSILIWTLPDKQHHWFSTTAEAAAAASALASNHDVYTMVSLMNIGRRPHRRGGSKDAKALCGLWMDIDIVGDGHSTKKYPPTIEAALDILYDDTLPSPSYLIHTGGGVQAWWLFKEPWTLDTANENEQAAQLAKDWQILIGRRAQALGYGPDYTYDLARLLRIPGTTNRKFSDSIRPIKILDQTTHRLNASDFRQLLEESGITAKRAAPASWIQTYTGKRFDPLNPKIDDICLEDIGHALMYQCRFAGHCSRHYSVLEHTLRLTDLVSPANKRWALIHDASEAYISDIARPVKHLPQFAFYREIEEQLMQRICDRFDLPYEQPNEVTDADKAMLWWEYQALFDHHLPEWKQWEPYGLLYPQASFERRGWRDGADDIAFYREASIWGLK